MAKQKDNLLEYKEIPKGLRYGTFAVLEKMDADTFSWQIGEEYAPQVIKEKLCYVFSGIRDGLLIYTDKTRLRNSTTPKIDLQKFIDTEKDFDTFLEYIRLCFYVVENKCTIGAPKEKIQSYTKELQGVLAKCIFPYEYHSGKMVRVNTSTLNT